MICAKSRNYGLAVFRRFLNFRLFFCAVFRYHSDKHKTFLGPKLKQLGLDQVWYILNSSEFLALFRAGLIKATFTRRLYQDFSTSRQMQRRTTKHTENYVKVKYNNIFCSLKSMTIKLSEIQKHQKCLKRKSPFWTLYMDKYLGIFVKLIS